MFNLLATLNAFRVVVSPGLTRPHLTVPAFDAVLPLPLFIRGVVVDKDNCFAKDGAADVWPAYRPTWERLVQTYPGRVLIVLNLAGTRDDQSGQAEELERNTGVPVLRHATKKPGCGADVVAWMRARGVEPAEVAVVGDRLFTDIVMARSIGGYGVWVRDGVVVGEGLAVRAERWMRSE